MSCFLEGSGMEGIHRVLKPIFLYLGEGIKIYEFESFNIYSCYTFTHFLGVKMGDFVVRSYYIK